MIRKPGFSIASGAMATMSIATSACVDAGASPAASASVPEGSAPVSIALDMERCFGRTALLPEGPYTAYPTRPQPRMATDEVAINGTREEPRFAIFNRTGEAIAELYWMPSGGDEWNDNQVQEGAVLSPQQFCTASVAILPDAGEDECRFDMRAVTVGGRTVNVTFVDVCKVSRVVFD